MKWIGILISVLLIVAISVLLIRRQSSSTRETLKDYNVILISIDTIRADYLQVYSPEGAPTPHLDSIAQNGFVFTRAISQVPLTLPSHCSMLTGMYPFKLLVQNNTINRLTDNALTLSEILKNSGYTTAGFIGAFVLASSTGISQGFDTYNESFESSEMKKGQELIGLQRSADDVYSSFLQWFNKKEPGKFFAFLHFYDPHSPYHPPPDFRPKSPTPEELYKGVLRYVDSVIGRLYDDLGRSGVWDNTILIITGDHGEMFGEHEERGHGFFLYEPALRVPLIVAVPGLRPTQRVDRIVELVDLMPTILDLLGLPLPVGIQGESFMPLLEGNEFPSGDAVAETLTATQTFGAAPLRSIQDARYKFIDSAHPELYDVLEDPLEQNNLYGQKKDISTRMQQKLQAKLRRYSADPSERPEDRHLSAEELEQLAALGYIGGDAPPVDRSLDAKVLIQQWNNLLELFACGNDGNYEKCLQFAEKMRAAGPFPVAAQIAEAGAYAGVGDHGKAVLLLKKILQDNPQNDQALSTLADTYQKSGDFLQASAIYKNLWEKLRSTIHLQSYASMMINSARERQLRSDLEQWEKSGIILEMHFNTVGEIYYNLKDPEKADFYLSKAFEANPRNEQVLTRLASLMDIRGETARALHLMESRKREFHHPNYLLQLGILYHKVGNPKQELETFQQLVRLYPDDPRGYFYLGKVLLDNGVNPNEVLQLSEKGLNMNPGIEYSVFGHDLQAEAYLKLGEQTQARLHSSKARQLESQLKE